MAYKMQNVMQNVL